MRKLGLAFINENQYSCLEQQQHPPSHRLKNHSCTFQMAHCRTSCRDKGGMEFLFWIVLNHLWANSICLLRGVMVISPTESTKDQKHLAMHQRIHCDLPSSWITCGSWMCSFLPWILWTMSSGCPHSHPTRLWLPLWCACAPCLASAWRYEPRGLKSDPDSPCISKATSMSGLLMWAKQSVVIGLVNLIAILLFLDIEVLDVFFSPTWSKIWV